MGRSCLTWRCTPAGTIALRCVCVVFLCYSDLQLAVRKDADSLKYVLLKYIKEEDSSQLFGAAFKCYSVSDVKIYLG